MSQGPPGGNTPTERAGSHIAVATILMVYQVVLGAFADTAGHVQTLGSDENLGTVIAIMDTGPGLFTLASWIGFAIVGGPLAAFGFPLGAIGGGIVVSPEMNPMTGLFLALLGGTLTWTGLKTGGWRPFL